MPPVALIAGPTASGKSALALALAEATGGTIINSDASQVYADLEILSARPGREEMARASHKLFGTINGATACSAAHWAELARQELFNAWNSNSLPILVGGTGLYLNTLLNGIAPIPDIDPKVRTAVRNLPVAEAHQELAREDPLAAQRLHPSDTTRVARALEIIRSTGRTAADWQRRREGGIEKDIRLAPIITLPPRKTLYANIDQRFEQMLALGAEQEVSALLARGLDPLLPVMRAIGVREIAAWQQGEIDRDEMIQRGQRATRQYAKRQYTWFSHQPPTDWGRLNEQLTDKNIEKIVIKLQSLLLTY